MTQHASYIKNHIHQAKIQYDNHYSILQKNGLTLPEWAHLIALQFDKSIKFYDNKVNIILNLPGLEEILEAERCKVIWDE